MKIFIDIGHPAHVHYFKNFIKIMKGREHDIMVTSRDKEMALKLLEEEGIEYTNRGKGANGIIGKINYLVRANYRIYKLANEFKPDLFLSFGSPYLAHVSKLLGKPHVTFGDTDHNVWGQYLTFPFSDLVLNPTVFKGKSFNNQYKFEGYMELCYLHPNHFTLNPDVLKKVDLKEGDTFSILRFVSWNAIHDIGHQGFTNKEKETVVEKLSEYGKVFITSEAELPPSLEPYKLKGISVSEIHHLLAFASLMYGESATMASESAMLGVPSIFHDNDGRGYTDDQEKKYGLVHNFTESTTDKKQSLNKAIEILKNDKSIFKNKRGELLKEKIDVTAFMVWLIENYPESKNTLKANPAFQSRFKV